MTDTIDTVGIIGADAVREICGAAGFAALLAVAAVVCLPAICKAWDRGSRTARRAFLAFAAAAAMYAGAKHGTIAYPRTDPETWYLRDSGSYVTNDHVHVQFTRNVIVPDSATFYLDGLDIQYTNQSDWAEHSFTAYSATFGEIQLPLNVPYANATNFNWIAYTDWVPPPVVHTNGIAYVAWQVGVGKTTNDLATTRTGIYVDGLRLAPNPAITNGPPVFLMQQTTNPQEDNQ